jgi:hypothetical protein
MLLKIKGAHKSANLFAKLLTIFLSISTSSFRGTELAGNLRAIENLLARNDMDDRQHDATILEDRPELGLQYVLHGAYRTSARHAETIPIVVRGALKMSSGLRHKKPLLFPGEVLNGDQ